MPEIFDFRGSAVGDTVTIETAKGLFTITKEKDGEGLRGWTLFVDELGSKGLDLLVLEQPFMTSGAIVRKGHEVGVVGLEGPKIITSLGAEPVITRVATVGETSVA